ncbi:methyltransferase [Paraflavisolibacter sp. H34]|uniref:class I SAM-dependent methyltransferase n=1 Tax=Huijunlia imazamoxiresistens TaxID=3127457 RepID=UPI00301B4C36
MNTELQIIDYEWDQKQVQLYVPDPQTVMERYRKQKEANALAAFPYWTQIWPAALAMARFIGQHPHYLTGRSVLELAAGLGLPSLVAAHYAATVICSDYQPEAVAVQERSVLLNGFTNVRCAVLDWHHLPAHLSADVLLLSDINYDPSEFEGLYHLLISFWQRGTTIILSTPQRLMAKPFIERLLPLCMHQEEFIIRQETVVTATSMYVLQKKA